MGSRSGKITVAVIGLGTIGPRHADCVLANEATDLVAIVDPNPQPEAAAVYRKLGVAFHPSVQDLLASQHKPDAAIICTPNHLHPEITRELANAGIHVLIEKPLCTDVETGTKLLAELRETRGRAKVLVGHHRRYNPVAIAIAEAIASGSLGRVIAINGLFMMMKPVEYFNTNWRRTKAAGPCLTNFIHDIDLFHFFLGRVARVYAEKVISQRGYEAEEGAGIVLTSASGVVGTFCVCDNVRSPYGWELGTGDDPQFPRSGQDVYRIFGTDATLSAPDMTRWSYDGQPVKSREGAIVSHKLDIEEGDPFARQLAHFVQVIRGQEEPRCTLEAGLAALVVCDAILTSMDTGAPVNIEPYEL